VKELLKIGDIVELCVKKMPEGFSMVTGVVIERFTVMSHNRNETDSSGIVRIKMADDSTEQRFDWQVTKIV
jgi:hypothetical protein